MTVRAKLTFFGNRAARIPQAALLIATPGTTAGVGGGSQPDAYYRSSEIVRGAYVSATSPRSRTLLVRAPRTLSPGTYPVLYAFRSALLPGQQLGIYGPFIESGSIGAVRISR